MSVAPTCSRTTFLIAGIEPEFDGAGTVAARSFELPFFHRIHGSTYKNRVTTDYFGVFDVAVRRHNQFEFHGSTEPEFARDFRVRRRNLGLDLAVEIAL